MVLTSRITTTHGRWTSPFGQRLFTIEHDLGLAENKMEEIALLMVDENKRLEATGNASFGLYYDAMMGWLKTSTKPEMIVDLNLFASVLEIVELITVDLSKTLSPAKKSQAVVMLYRALNASGKVDQQMIEEAVKLAAG